MIVAVYGTLKRGYGNNVCLDGATFIGNTFVEGYKLFYSHHTGHSFGFPVAHKSKGDTVEVELFELPDGEVGDQILGRLDRLESNGFMYDRVEVETGVHMYVGCDRAWTWDKMIECPNTNNIYRWDRG